MKAQTYHFAKFDAMLFSEYATNVEHHTINISDSLIVITSDIISIDTNKVIYFGQEFSAEYKIIKKEKDSIIIEMKDKYNINDSGDYTCILIFDENSIKIESLNYHYGISSEESQRYYFSN